MTKIIPTGVIGWKIIPVGSMYRVYHMKPGRCYWKYRSGWLRGKLRGRCLSVEVRPWSAWPVEPKRPHASMEIVRKEHSKGGINVSEHERICGRFRRYCSDVWEHTSCTCAHTCAHVKDFQPNFYKPYGTFVPDFCIPSGKRKVAENWRFGDHIACSIFTRTVSTLKASFDTTLESLQIFSALTWEMNFLSDWFSICFWQKWVPKSNSNAS